MKTIQKLIFLLLAVMIITTSCSKEDALETLPGTWTTSDGGMITFVSNGTGTTLNSDFFEFDCGTITSNGVSEQIGPIADFTWQINTEDGSDNLYMAFDDQTSFSIPCAGSMEFPIRFDGPNKAIVGIIAFGFGVEVELTR